MAGYVNGKIEIWCGDYAPYNLNILWYKRIKLSPGVFSYELLDYDNVSNTWSPIQVTAAESIRGILAGSNNVTIDNTDPNFPVISVDVSVGEAPIDTFQYARQDGGWVKVLIPEGLTLGETFTTAYRGDRGKIAYNHSQTDHAPSNAEANVIIGLQKNGIDLIQDSNRKVNVTVPTQPSDIGAATSSQGAKADTALQSFTETDPTVPLWAKTASKPTYTASEVGAEPAKGDDDNYITDDQLAKLDGIEAGAQVNDANTVIDPNYIHIDQESLGELIETTELETVTDNTKVAVSDSEFLKYVKGLSIYTYIKSKLDLVYQPLKSALELYVSQTEKNTWDSKQNTLTFSTDIESDKASTTKISAIKTFYDWAVGKFEKLSNKTSDIAGNASSTEKYPNVKGLVDYIYAMLLFEQETINLINRMTVKPNIERAMIINQTIKTKKASGIWSKLDCYYEMNAHDVQAAKLNWIKDAHNLETVGTVAFVADEGFTCNGVNSYIKTNYKPSVNAVNYKLNENSFGIFVRKTVDAGMVDIGSCTSGSVDRNFINSNFTISTPKSQFYSNTNEANLGNLEAFFLIGIFGISRTSATNIICVTNNKYKQITQQSSSIPNFEIYIGARNTGGTATAFSSRQYSSAFIGGVLTENDFDNLFESTEYYRNAIQDSIKINSVEPPVIGLQGYTTDGEYHYTFDKDGIYKWDYSWKLIFCNKFPLLGLPAGVIHIGDGSYYNGKLYIGCDSVDAFTNSIIAIYDATSLQLLSTINVVNETNQASGCVVVPEDNAIYVVNYFNNQNKIFRYNLTTGAYVSSITMASSIIGMQGITYDGTFFYITSHIAAPRLERVYKVSKDGSSVSIIYTTTDYIELQGINYYDSILQFQTYTYIDFKSFVTNIVL